MASCNQCGDHIPLGRFNLGYNTCLQCGEFAAKKYASTHFTVTIPYSKGAYQVVSVSDLKTTNPKR